MNDEMARVWQHSKNRYFEMKIPGVTPSLRPEACVKAYEYPQNCDPSGQSQVVSREAPVGRDESVLSSPS